MDTTTQCFVSLSQRTIIELLNGDGSAQFGCHSLEAARRRYPDAQQMLFDDAFAAIEKSYIDADATPCTEEEFNSAYNQLVPYRMGFYGDIDLFAMGEHQFGRVTRFYVRRGRNFYSFFDLNTITREQVIAKLNRTAPA